jgi:hypothetical protein
VGRFLFFLIDTPKSGMEESCTVDISHAPQLCIVATL